MASDFSINLLGEKQLLRKLDRLSDKIGRRVLAKAMRAASRPVIKAARANVPTDSGNLKKSLGVRLKFYRGSGTEVAIVGPRIRGQRTTTIKSGANAGKERVTKGLYGRHGHLVEFGTQARYTKTGKFTGIMPANPFMRRAWDSMHKAAERAGIDKLKKEVEKEARRGG